MAALSTASQQGKFDLVVITNELVREGGYQIIRQGQISAGRADRSKLGAAYAAYPLTDAAVVDSVLEDVASHFPPETHEFVLIVKSHGNADLALTSMMAGKINVASAARLAEALKTAAQAKVESDASSSEKRTLNPEVENNTLSIDGKTAGLVGLTKDQLVGTLSAAGSRGMRFPLVVLEAWALPLYNHTHSKPLARPILVRNYCDYGNTRRIQRTTAQGPLQTRRGRSPG